MSSPDRKRQRIDDHSLRTSHPVAVEIRSRRAAFLASLDRGVSPPAGRELPPPATTVIEKAPQTERKTETPPKPPISPLIGKLRTQSATTSKCSIIQSPFKLTHIRDLPANANIDTISVRDILGDVMLKEVWLFDFLYDVDWVMQQFDPDIQHIVSVVLVHGSWRREDPNKIHIDEACKRYSNVKAVTAYMPEPFGTHHTKGMVLFRRDDLAQVIVHTANMIEQDWRNLSQGVWLSPLLPRLASPVSKETSGVLPAIGSGSRFKRDFMAYLQHYQHRTASLVSQLEQYDFSAIKAALVAHVPAKFDGIETEPSVQLWGWPALKRTLKNISPEKLPEQHSNIQSPPHIVCQVSSIASLPEKWIRDTLFAALAKTSTAVDIPTKNSRTFSQARPRYSIIFPTPSEIRTCLDGYAAGASIHCKLQNTQQRKQFEFMKPHLCHWNAEHSRSAVTSTGTSPSSRTGKALRGPAAPHIKTFIRFSDSTAQKTIDWALLTSANLSTQAWGTAAQIGSGEVKVSSYELGVLVWPDLFLDSDTTTTSGEGKDKSRRKRRATMVPTFGSNTPSDAQIRDVVTASPTRRLGGNREERTEKDSDDEEAAAEDDELVIVALRMPYDLPLTPYSPDDEVWSAKSSHTEPDSFGGVWNV
ncbi:hypothetical protein EPUS_01911 [Endocarpon pusillum Z07020]|uniref:PLD phosphodiesterase domain-containing protein n=1 Tax=Endocarpon pusillum (strain Z07020 / HMAS-L-300199) TaxID=1263415 RepID=U1GD09_ENDPU|nr:uncharacterized protein EPUS_01911 [Endocarpon pusillum Z07020]ERF69581.1 hypothetical protein EPUS_01911 [Endocarpon pusillum Z07020]